MKKIIIIFITILIFSVLSACGNTGDDPVNNSVLETNAPVDYNTPAGNNSTPNQNEPDVYMDDPINHDFGDEITLNAKIAFSVQEYDIEYSIIEIPYIDYDYYDGENPAIEDINRFLNQHLNWTYTQFIETNANDWGDSLEIRSYPFTCDDYLQVVITSIEYPIVGTAGDLRSVNYDRKADKAIWLADAMAEAGLNEAAISKAVTEMYIPAPGQFIREVEPVGFLYRNGPIERFTQFLLEVRIEYDGADSYKHFYYYAPALNELGRMNPDCLFDPFDMDQMNPPLAYQK